MKKTILITGSTDGIGKLAAAKFAADGHTVLVHGRNADKADRVSSEVRADHPNATVEVHIADLSDMSQVRRLGDDIKKKHERIDVLINNAGVFKTRTPTTPDGLDIRFVVNTLAPWVLTQSLTPVIPPSGRVVNLSSAAQAPVSLAALRGDSSLSDNAAYAQSKLAITMWTRALAAELGRGGPQIIAVNPASLLGTNMVREAYGSSGKDVGIGADIIYRAALSEEFSDATGKYFDNDADRFARPHPHALDDSIVAAFMKAMHDVLATLSA